MSVLYLEMQCSGQLLLQVRVSISSALEGSHQDNPLKDLSVGQDTGQGYSLTRVTSVLKNRGCADQRDFPGQIGTVGN